MSTRLELAFHKETALAPQRVYHSTTTSKFLTQKLRYDLINKLTKS